MKPEALTIQKKLITNDTLTYEDRTFLIGFIYFALELREFIGHDRRPTESARGS
jgi:hypothetical protein